MARSRQGPEEVSKEVNVEIAETEEKPLEKDNAKDIKLQENNEKHGTDENEILENTRNRADDITQSSFLDKYLSDSKSEEEVQHESEDHEIPKQKERCEIVNMWNGKTTRKVKRKSRNEKRPSQCKPSSRWRNLRMVVGKDSDEEEDNTKTPPYMYKETEYCRDRRPTVPRIPTEQIESSTESDEEDDRVLDGKVSVADLPSEYWQIQRLVKYLRIGNQTATVITLCGLTDFNLTQEMTQMAIRNVSGLTVLVNILRTDHVNCQIGALKILQQLTLNSKYNRRTVIKQGGVQILIDLITFASREVQGLAAANLANMAKSSLGRNIMKRYGGIQRLVSLLNYDNGKNNYRRQSTSVSADLEVARNAALALWSCSKSTRSRSAIYNAGGVPLLAKLIKLDKQDFLIPFVGLAQECAVEFRFREAFYKENMITGIARRLQTENQELQGYCASAIFKCAEDEQTRKAVYDCGGLDTLVALLCRRDNKTLLSAVTGAIWKCAISEYNVKRLMSVNVVGTLFKLLQNEEQDEEELPEQVQLHIVGAIGEIAKDPKGPLEVLRCKGCNTLVDILNIPNEELTGTAARAIAACAVNSACRAVFNRLECLRLLWSLMKSKNNKVVSGAAWAVYRLMQDTPEAWETARSFVGGLDLTVRLLKFDDLEVLISACAVISTIACDRENLGVITDYDVVSHLAHLTHKTDILLRRHLAEAIAMCSKWGNNAKRFCDKGVVKSMVEYLGSRDIIVQRSAMRALEQLGKSPESCIIMHRGGVVKLLLGMIGSEDAGLQEAAAGCLLNMRQLAMANERAGKDQWNGDSNSN
ncbi:outer dynein arm-docking complex subunit 2-like isoform X3 [Montipora capricornis]|uniref:outer dynein arm-docking complex subunit 2-like isoform X3 n=1 Tax=Montipora capricornis TaxID=246305 RepID=UPI0035F185F0